MKIKALSVRQPWANMLVYGHKSIEIRTWRTNYRGRLLICAAKKIDSDADIGFFLRARDMYDPRGVAVGTTELVDVRPLVREDYLAGMFKEEAFDKNHKLLAWVMERPKRFEVPFAVKGQLSLFNVEMRP